MRGADPVERAPVLGLVTDTAVRGAALRALHELAIEAGYEEMAFAGSFGTDPPREGAVHVRLAMEDEERRTDPRLWSVHVAGSGALSLTARPGSDLTPVPLDLDAALSPEHRRLGSTRSRAERVDRPKVLVAFDDEVSAERLVGVLSRIDELGGHPVLLAEALPEPAPAESQRLRRHPLATLSLRPYLVRRRGEAHVSAELVVANISQTTISVDLAPSAPALLERPADYDAGAPRRPTQAEHTEEARVRDTLRRDHRRGRLPSLAPGEEATVEVGLSFTQEHLDQALGGLPLPLMGAIRVTDGVRIGALAPEGSAVLITPPVVRELPEAG